MENMRVKNNKKITKFGKIFTVFVIINVFFVFIIILSNNEKKLNEKKNIENLISTINNKYSDYVKTIKETNLYKLENGKYIKSGKVNKNVNLNLKKENMDENTKYFHIKDLDLYIPYKDVEKTEQIEINTRYNYLVPFDKNIKTKQSTTFYNSEKQYLYKINYSYDFSVIVDDDDFYGVIYNDQLVYINKNEVEKEYENKNSDIKTKKRIRTLLYHFIYDSKNDTCNQIICHKLSDFENELKYLKENNFFTMTLEEVEMFMDGKIQIPEKSIAITIDDGTVLSKKIKDLLKEYDQIATLFVITGWVDANEFTTDHLLTESHTDSMHNQYECKGYGQQGGGILCLDEEKVLNDLKLSQEKLNGSKYFAYPFFDFNDRAIDLLKKAGFNMAFIGQYDTEGFSYPNKTDKYKMRRSGIFSDTTYSEFLELVNE